MSVAITVPALEAIALSGSGTIAARNIHSQRLTLALSGSGVLRAGHVVSVHLHRYKSPQARPTHANEVACRDSLSSSRPAGRG